LYSGFLASSLWMLRVVRGGQQVGYRGRAAIPAGYDVRIAGVLLFGVAGVGDFVWHTIFGIEADVEALLSQPHLALLTGGLLMAAGPIVSTLERERSRLPEDRASGDAVTGSWSSTGAIVGALTFMVSVVGFFLMYISPYDYGRFDDRRMTELGSRGWLYNETISAGVASVLLFSVVLAIALSWLVRTVGVPRGGLLCLFAVPAVLQTALTSFDTIHRATGALVAGVVAEATYAWVRSRPGQPVVLAVWIGGLTALSWFVMFGAIEWRDGLGWTAPQWSGSALLGALVSALLTVAGGPTTRGISFGDEVSSSSF
jgi:hypothetical protein